MHLSIHPLPGESLSDAMPEEGWEERLLKESENAAYSVGKKFQSEAIRNAPISPSLGILKKLGMGVPYTTKPTKRRGSIVIKATDFYKPAAILAALGGKASHLGVNPGGLSRSIQLEYADDHVDVFVPSNSEGADYAEKIHDEKGITWKHRGPGTQAKGPQADDKFIGRALDVWKGEFQARMKKAYEIAFRRRTK